jgi:hypothetical protein
MWRRTHARPIGQCIGGDGDRVGQTQERGNFAHVRGSWSLHRRKGDMFGYSEYCSTPTTPQELTQ